MKPYLNQNRHAWQKVEIGFFSAWVIFTSVQLKQQTISVGVLTTLSVKEAVNQKTIMPNQVAWLQGSALFT